MSYIRPIAGSVGIALDIKEVAENFILIGVLRTVEFRFIKECTQHKLYYIGKCIWFVEGFITSIYRTGTSMAVVNYSLGIHLGHNCGPKEVA